MPQKICTDCFSKFCTVSSFRLQCQEAQTILSNIFDKIDTQSIQDDEVFEGFANEEDNNFKSTAEAAESTIAAHIVGETDISTTSSGRSSSSSSSSQNNNNDNNNNNCNNNNENKNNGEYVCKLNERKINENKKKKIRCNKGTLNNKQNEK